MEARKSPEIANLFRDKHGDDTTLSQVIEIGRQVEAMTSHPGWDAVVDLLGELRDKRMRELMLPEKPLEQADYSYRIGVLKGTETALYAAETIVTIADEVRREVEREAARPVAER